MTQLYKLTERYRTIAEMLDEEHEYISEESIRASLSDIKDQIEEKIENIAKLVLSLKGDTEAIAKEEERLASRRKAVLNNIEWLKSYMLAEMLATDTKKVKRDVISVWLASNQPSVEIIDLEEIPELYRRIIPETWNPDKKAIIEHFNETGEIVPGIDIITGRKHIQIR